MKFGLKFSQIIFLVCIGLLFTGSLSAQTKMSKEEWQKQIRDNSIQRDNLKKDITQLNREIDSLQALTAELDSKFKKVKEETNALAGASDDNRREFSAALDQISAVLDELAKLNDQDLYSRKKEVDSVQARLHELKSKKLAALQPYYDRIQGLQQRIDALRAVLSKSEIIAGAEKIYTVGTWAKNRDCLWNISKKKDIYANPFMWPKIWQGNREKIKDPDLIYPGQKLKIPPAGALTDAEKKAENQYYWRKKRAQ